MNFRQSDEETVQFQMAPLIDCVFLLLIFFMSASTFHILEREADIKLPVADKSKTREESQGELVINVKSDGTIIFSDASYDPAGLLAELKKMAGTFDKTRVRVIIRGDKQTSHGMILQVMAACAAADIRDVSFGTFREKTE